MKPSPNHPMFGPMYWANDRTIAPLNPFPVHGNRIKNLYHIYVVFLGNINRQSLITDKIACTLDKWDDRLSHQTAILA